MSASKRCGAPLTSATTPATAVPARVRLELHRPRVAQQGDVGPLQRGTDGDDFGVGLGVQEARESVAGLAADAAAVGHVRFVQHHRGGRRKRVVAGGGEIVVKLLDARFVRDRRRRIGRARRRFGGVEAAFAVHLIELLGLGVVGLEFVVGDRPGGRDAVIMPYRAEVLLSQAIERRAENLGGAADEIVNLGLERRAVGQTAMSRGRRSGWPETRLRHASCAPRAAASRRAPG